MSESMERDISMEFLKNKRTLLSSPGFLLNDIYYSALNTTVSEAEVTYNTGRLTISLSQLSFGSQSQIIIPNSSLLSTLYLHLQLPQLTANVMLPRGWGYASINSLSYLFGSSNVSQLQINGQSLLQRNLEECETSEKRSEVFNLGGQAQIDTSAPVNDAYLVLNLPFSRNQGFMQKLPYDTNLLSNPITVQIQFNPAISFMGGSGLAAYLASISNSFARGTVLIRQGDFFNKEQSLKLKLLKNPDMHYSYPFIHAQSFTPTAFTGQTSSGSPVSLTLQSFINADLVHITFGVIKSSDLVSVGGGSVNPFKYEAISNVQVLFNGIVMYNSPAQVYKLFNMNSDFGASYFENASISGTGPFAPLAPINTYIIRIDFARIKTLIFENHYQNVWRIGNNVLTLTFNTQSTDPYQLFATYYYNGVIESSNGESRIYFD